MFPFSPSVHLWSCRKAKAWYRSAMFEVGREMCSVEMAIGKCLTQTNIIHPAQYPKMANYTDQLAG